MSEENKRSTELNDAELKEVSGGQGATHAALDSAKRYCAQCDRKRGCDRVQRLAIYLDGMGIDSLLGPQYCPYYEG